MNAQEILSFINPDDFVTQASSFDEIIEEAIEHEKTTFRQYMQFSKLVKSEVAKDAFIKLAYEELKHADILEQVQEHGYDFFKVPQATETLNQKTIDCASEIKLHPSITLDELLLFAIRQELGTYEYYKKMAQKSTRKITHDTFVKLARLEFSHAKRLENIYKENFI